MINKVSLHIQTASFKKNTLLLFVFSFLFSFPSLGQTDIEKDLLEVNKLNQSIEIAYKNKSDSTSILINKALKIIKKYDVEDCSQQYVDIHFWEALYYLSKKEVAPAIKILEEIHLIALHKKHLRFGEVSQHLATSKQKLDSSFNGNRIFEEAFQKIDTTLKTRFLIQVFKGQGDYYYKNNDSKKALEAYQNAITLQDQVKADSLFSKIFKSMSILYFYDGQLYKAIETSDMYAYYADKINDAYNVNIGKGNSAIFKTKLGRFDEAIETYFELLKICEVQNDLSCLINTQNSIGTAYTQMGNSNKAIEHYKKSIELILLNKDKGKFKNEKDIASYNIAIEYRKLKEYDKSLNVSKKLIEELGEDTDFRILGRTYLNVALNYSEINNIQQAKHYFKEAIKIQKKQGNENEIYSSYAYFGKYLIRVGETQKGGTYCKDAYKILSSLDNIKAKERCLDCLSDYYEKVGDFKNSLNYYKNYIILRDSLVSDNNNTKLTSEKLKYEYEKKQSEIKYKIEQLSLLSTIKDTKIDRRNSVIIGTLTTLLLGFFFFYYRYKKNKAHAIFMKGKNDELNKNNEKLNSLYDNLNTRNSELNKSNIELNQRKVQVEGELKSKFLLISSYSEVLSSLQEKITEDKNINTATKTKFNKLIRQNDNKDLLKEIDFGFMELNKDFVKALTSKYPSLTNNNIKLCLLLKMNLYTKEIAQILHSSPDSIKVAKSRLRKKFNLEESNHTLVSFLNSFENKKIAY